MPFARDSNRSRGAGARALCLAVACAGVAAAGASAATLRVTVRPGAIHSQTQFTIAVSGSYRQRELPGQAFLLSFIQYSTVPCKAGATQEFYAYGRSPYFFHTLSRSPFSRTDAFKAGATGRRRVCAYLYPKQIKPGSTLKPLKTATTTYRVSR